MKQEVAEDAEESKLDHSAASFLCYFELLVACTSL
jgi:hypothetical protein